MCNVQFQISGINTPMEQDNNGIDKNVNWKSDPEGWVAGVGLLIILSLMLLSMDLFSWIVERLPESMKMS